MNFKNLLYHKYNLTFSQDEICQFVMDPSPSVRICVLRFIHHVIKVDSESLPILSSSLIQLLHDEHYAVVAAALAQVVNITVLYKFPIYKETKYPMSVKETFIELLNEVQHIFESENDGLRTQAARTTETFAAFQAKV